MRVGVPTASTRWWPVSDVSDFLRCPNCRKVTVELVHHIDGDFSIQCDNCDEYASGDKLHEHDRVHSYKHAGTKSE